MAIPQDFFHIFKVGVTDNLAITWSRNERVNEAMAFPVGEKLLCAKGTYFDIFRRQQI